MATIVEGNPKAPFPIATTPMYRGGRYSFPGLLYFTLDPYLIMQSVNQGGIKYHFLSLFMTRPGIEPRSPGPLANTLTPRPMSGIKSGTLLYIYIYIYRYMYKMNLAIHYQARLMGHKTKQNQTYSNIFSSGGITRESPF